MGRLLDQADGVGVYGFNLLRHMFALDPATRYLVLLRTDKSARLWDAYPNVAIRVVSSRSKVWWDQVIAPRAARNFGADLIFNPKFSLPLLTHIPGVFVLHDSDWFINPGNYPWWDNIYIRVMLPIYCRKAAKLLSISQIVIDGTVKYIGLDRSKAILSYAAAAPHFQRIQDGAALREFAERHRLPREFIFTVGRVYHTGHDRLHEYPGGNNESLVRGYRRYRALGGTLLLVVAGRDIEQYLRSHGFGDRDLEGLHFIGFIPNTEIVKAYNLAEFFVLAKLYESFSLPLVEAMSCGCPALVPETGACPEVGGDAAMYVNPLDPEAIGGAMLKLAESKELRMQMRKAGMKRASFYTWDQTAKITLDVLNEACSPKDT